MEETENVTTDYAALVKESVVKGAVTAVVSVIVTYGTAALITKLQSRRNKTELTTAEATE